MIIFNPLITVLFFFFSLRKLWLVGEPIEDGDQQPAEPVEDVGWDVGLQHDDNNNNDDDNDDNDNDNDNDDNDEPVEDVGGDVGLQHDGQTCINRLWTKLC